MRPGLFLGPPAAQHPFSQELDKHLQLFWPVIMYRDLDHATPPSSRVIVSINSVRLSASGPYAAGFRCANTFPRPIGAVFILTAPTVTSLPPYLPVLHIPDGFHWLWCHPCHNAGTNGQARAQVYKHIHQNPFPF